MSVLFPENSTPPPVADTLQSHNGDPLVFEHLIVCSKEGKAPGELWCPNCVAIDPTTNHIYVTEGEGVARVSVFSERGEFLHSYTHEHMESLYGIAIHDENLYVTDWAVHSVFRIKIESDLRLVARTGTYGSDTGQFYHPRQLSISTNGDIYVTDCWNDRVQILDSSLHPIRAITHPSMHSPCDVKLTKHEVYVLSDEDSPCVHVFSYSGHKIRSLLTSAKDMEVAIPFGFCLDSSKNILISYWYSDQVTIFSKDGDILYTLGGCGEDIGMFYSPTGLALHSDHKLIVISLNKEYRLQIYSS